MAERSCFTCAHAVDDDGQHDSGRCNRLLLNESDDDVIVAYAEAARLTEDGVPTDRTVDCPLWAAPKEER